MPKQPEPPRLDLSRFKSTEDAVEQANAVAANFFLIGNEAQEATSGNVYLPTMFVWSAISRAVGLHTATLYAIENSNPHAAIPLIRSYADLAITARYVLDHPRYVYALTERRGETKQKRLRMGALVQAVKKHATGLQQVYDELSEGTHFGAVAMWGTFRPTGGGIVAFGSVPQWRDPDRDPLIMASYLIELGELLTLSLRGIIKNHLVPLNQLPPSTASE